MAGTRIGIVLALAFVTLPFSVRSVQPVLAELDREAEEAAASLGASPARVLRRIVLPSIAPAMLAGAGLAFARAVGEFGSVVLISGNLPFKTEVASSWIYSLSQSDALPAAAAVSVVLIVISLWSSSSPSACCAGASTVDEVDMKPRWRWPLRVAALGYLALLVIIPVGAVFYRAFEHGFVAAWDAVTTPDALHALWLTALVVVIAVPLNTVFGVGVALILARHRFPGAWLLDALVDLPLAISPVVVGLALILVYGKTGWFGNWLAAHGIDVIFSVPGIVMASAAVSLPYVVREVLPVLQEIGTEQEQAAATLGAGPVHHLPAHHPALHPLGPRLRRHPHHRPGARRVRGRGHRVGGHRRARPRPSPCSSPTASRTSTRSAPTPGPSSWPSWRSSCSPCWAPIPRERSGGGDHHPISLQAIRRRRRSRRREPGGPRRLADRAPRTERRRQVHPAAGHRRAGDPRHRHGRDRRRGRDQGPGARPGHRLLLPALRPVPAPDRPAERRLRPRGPRRPKAEIRRRVDELLELVRIAHLADRYPSQLSGGQRQRMALARALAIEPRVLLLDEPFGALDAQVRQQLRTWLRELHEKIDVTTVLVTHDQEEAMEVADRLAIINEGRLEQVGSPAEIYDHPDNEFVLSFLGPGDASSTASGSAPTTWCSTVDLGLGGRRATVERVTHLGFEVRVDLSWPTARPIWVQLSRGHAAELDLRAGDEVWVTRSSGTSATPPLSLQTPTPTGS